MLAAARSWAEREVPKHPTLSRLAIFGSYARGDCGVGSDLDLLAIVREAREPFIERGLAWDLLPLPVPAEIVVYTESEWERLERQGARFHRTIANEALWLYPASA